jgi:hypothetical protein
VTNTSFTRFVAASGLTNLADGIAVVAWAWMASLLTRDPLLVALMPVALRLPWFIFAIPAGIVTDRIDRRILILWMDVIRAVAFAIATVVIWQALPLATPSVTGLVQPTVFFILMATALLVGGAEVFRDNAAQTMLPSLVTHDALERANGRLWSAELIGNSLVGPALGAFLIAAFAPAPFALNSIAYAVALVCVMSLKGSFKPRPSEAAPNWRSELSEAYRFLKSSPPIAIFGFDYRRLEPCIPNVNHRLGAARPGKLKPWGRSLWPTFGRRGPWWDHCRIYGRSDHQTLWSKTHSPSQPNGFSAQFPAYGNGLKLADPCPYNRDIRICRSDVEHRIRVLSPT